MALSASETKKYEQVVHAFVEKRRPPLEIRDQVDLQFRLVNQSVEIFEVRPFYLDPAEKVESPSAKATYVKHTGRWKVYWQRADLKWHRYDPHPEVETLERFLELVDADAYGCFFG